MHIMPGFYNPLVVDQVNISSLSAPFSMYLNFDTTIIGVILFLNSNLYSAEKTLDMESLLTTIVLTFICTTLLMFSGLALGYIKFNFKLPDVMAIWCVNNLFFVSFAEEVVFRGFIQNNLRAMFQTNQLRYLPLILTAILFGIVHYGGGMVYILLATIAGIFYGLAYEKTKRISSAILVHFSLNLIHFVFFTYPVVKSA